MFNESIVKLGPKPQIVALCGNPGSGKSTLAASLSREFGYSVISGSKILQIAAHEKGIILNSRADYDSFHRLWRDENGLDAMAQKILATSRVNKDAGLVCFENLRNKYDALALKATGAMILALWCPIRERFRRIQSFADTKHSLDFSEFRKMEAQEYFSSDERGSHVLEVMGMADMHLDASKQIGHLVSTFKRILS